MTGRGTKKGAWLVSISPCAEIIWPHQCPFLFYFRLLHGSCRRKSGRVCSFVCAVECREQSRKKSNRTCKLLPIDTQAIQRLTSVFVKKRGHAETRIESWKLRTYKCIRDRGKVALGMNWPTQRIYLVTNSREKMNGKNMRRKKWKTTNNVQYFVVKKSRSITISDRKNDQNNR